MLYKNIENIYSAKIENSNKRVIGLYIFVFMLSFVLILGVCVRSWPHMFLAVSTYLGALLFGGLVTWRLVLLGIAVLRGRSSSRRVLQQEVQPGLIYSVLVPVFKEAQMMPQLAAALKRLDWPAGALDIQILIEADDLETYVAAQQANFGAAVRLVCIPPGGPRTKPNALNYGLAHAQGHYICVFDAEDMPHPQQLRAAAAAFDQSDFSLACVQAPLIGVPAKSGWLAQQWSLEYAVQFRLLMPALSCLDLPILLGGTSNHFRTDTLRAIGGWDAWNVTEDADLGIRLSRLGYQSRMIKPPTYEQAPGQLSVWLRQRSRWIKGFMQTWLVLMRTPIKARRQLGWRGFLAVQLSLAGAIIAAFCYLPILVWLATSAFLPAWQIGDVGWTVLVGGVLVGLAGDVMALGWAFWRRLFLLISRPFYWALHTLSAYWALWELFWAPHYWAKTPHKPDG